MAQIGTNVFNSENQDIIRLAKRLDVVGVTGKAVQKSFENRLFEKAINGAMKSLSRAAKKQDAFQCFESEKICILFDKEFFAATEKEQKRLDKQLSENGAARFSATLIFDPEKYSQHVREVYGPNRKILFPPAGESCVNVARKQIQYLERSKAGMTSEKIKEFYSARQANLRCALNLCIEAQCKALDIPVPKQGKVQGLEL